jgi:hypothetical protein
MSTGKGGSTSQVTGYRYFMSLQQGLCRGPVNVLYEVRVGDLLAWSETLSASDFFEINQPNLFGGDQKEGGIDGTAKLFMGESTQTIDTIITDNIEGGFPVPGWRGVTSVFYYGLISSNNPYPKPWTFKVGRTTAGWDTDVWESGLALIPMTSSPLTLITFNTQPHSGDSIFIGEVEVDFFTIVSGPPFTNVQIGADAEATAAAFGAMCNAQSSSLYDVNATVNGLTVTLLFPASVDVHYGHGAFTSISSEGGGISAMNPAHILYECLTNTIWGRGLPTEFIDTATFQFAAQSLYNEGFGLCMKWNREGNIDSFVKQVVDHIGAALFIDRQSGKIKLNLIRDNYDHDLLVAFTFENGLLDVIEDEVTSSDTSFNEIIVKYTDPVSGKTGSLRVQNLASFQALGSIISVTAEYPGLPTATLAARVGQRDLQMNASDIRKYKLKFDRVAWYINPGDVFKINVPERGIENLIVRAGEIQDGPIDDETITIVAIQDVFSLPDASFVTPQPSYWVPPDRTARVIDSRLVDEMTYYDLSESIPPGELGVITEDTGLTKIFAEPPSGYSTDYVVASKTSLETDYVERTIAGFDAGAELTTSIPLHSTALNFGSVTNSFLITATGIPILLVSADDPTQQEYCELDAIDIETGTATLKRGCIDTVPHVFITGDKVWFQTNMPTSDFRDYSTGEIVDVKLLTRTTNDKLSLSLAIEDEIEIGGRQGRPYPPGKLMINSIAFELAQVVDGDIILEWAHRDRITQANFLVDHDQASTGPEAGTTYNVYVYDGLDDPAVDAPIRTETLISTDGFTYDSTMDAADGNLHSYWFRVESERDSLKSWQSYLFIVRRSAGFGDDFGFNFGGGPP